MYNWAVLKISYLHRCEGLDIILKTNSPCHLTSYYTDVEPRRHKASRTLRGLDTEWGAYFCFDSWLPLEQSEPGDTLTHTFIFPTWPICVGGTPFQSCASCSTPPYWEPWGTTLLENNAWLPNEVGNYVQYTLIDSILHMYNPPNTGAGFKYLPLPDVFPLITPNGSHLCIQARSINALTPSPHDFLPLLIHTTNGVNTCKDDLVIARGNAWGPWGSLKASEPFHSAIDYGLDPDPIDFLKHWQWARSSAGQSADPRGWYISGIRLIMETATPPSSAQLWNDFINLTYSDLDTTISPHPTRWFVFKGTVEGLDSPSVSAIYNQCLRPQCTITLLPSKDNYLDLQIPDTNKGTDYSLRIVGNSNTPTFWQIPLLSFSLPDSIIKGTILHAQLYMRWFSSAASGNTHYIHRLLTTDWLELESTYNQRYTGKSWTIGPFGLPDYSLLDPTPVPSVVGIFPDCDMFWDVTDFLKWFIEHAHHSLDICLLQHQPQWQRTWYYSRNSPIAIHQPQLTIAYRPQI